MALSRAFIYPVLMICDVRSTTDQDISRDLNVIDARNVYTFRDRYIVTNFDLWIKSLPSIERYGFDPNVTVSIEVGAETYGLRTSQQTARTQMQTISTEDPS